jgi:hypothetical protein
LTRRDDNLFTKDPYICLGYDLSGFNEEQAILFSIDNESFYVHDDIPDEKNEKTIRLRWLHEFEDGNIQVVNEATKMDKPYEIRWYRFELGKPSADEYSGVYWVRDLDPTKEIEYIDKQCKLFHAIRSKALTEDTVKQMQEIVDSLLIKYPSYTKLFEKMTPAEKIEGQEVKTYTLNAEQKE